ncbi:MAG TPA: DUF4142 domain-containing protein [Pseudomonas xinjiangensis]|uniref:DUF4142 domain-containing protein n=2 Tax=root TaxID=1 RepID=A0A7V1BN12_9GAMM|nr:DUF4142 domain-containing protein [Halopseudomonas xinjiangensis]HEC46880.1 DUF4142 domain-containing protein [Halopseudomonas xinjiangensis]
MKALQLLTMGIVTIGAAAVFRKMIEEKGIAPARFIDAAAAKGVSEVEAGKLALEKSSSVELKAFAYEMIDDHTAVNIELRQLARNKGYEMDSEAELTSKAKDMLLKLREEKSFDSAYADQQVHAHEQSITLFRQATQLDDFEVSSFARKTLPKLQQHLTMAHKLKTQLNEGPLRPNSDGAANGTASASYKPSTADTSVDSGKSAPSVTSNDSGTSSVPNSPVTPSIPSISDRDAEVPGADNSGGAMPKAPKPEDVTPSANKAKPLAGDSSGISKGTPQQNRGSAQNPGH